MSDPVPVPVPVPVPPSASPNRVEREQFWREILAAFTASGVSVRVFCRERGVPEKRFYTWRRKLGLSPVTRTSPAHSDRNTTFVPVRIVSDLTAEITLPGGLSIRLPVSADPAHVARLVAALRSHPC